MPVLRQRQHPLHQGGAHPPVLAWQQPLFGSYFGTTRPAAGRSLRQVQRAPSGSRGPGTGRMATDLRLPLLAQVRSRKGHLPDAVQQTRWDIDLAPGDPRNFVLSVTADTGLDSRREDVARALCKVALESRYREDPLDARHRRWDVVRSAAIGGALPPDLTMWLTHPASINDLNLSTECGLLCSPAGPLQFACRASVVGLTLHLFVGTPAPATFAHTAAWRIDAESGRLRGPGEFWGRFHGRAESATKRTIKQRPPADAPSGRHASRLPSRQPGTTIEIQRPAS